LDFNKMSLGEQIAFCEYFLHFDRWLKIVR
jgi:hypothetical protein